METKADELLQRAAATPKVRRPPSSLFVSRRI
jgi:hypothetical protein